MYASKLIDSDDAILKWYSEGYSIRSISRIMSLGISSIEYRLKVNGIRLRSRSEALKDKPKSETHRNNLSNSRIGRFMGIDHPNWKGGANTEYQRNITALKSNPKYKQWRREVLAIGYCNACGSTERLEAHHILMKSLFQHLVFVVSNGMALCHSCHKRLHKGIKMKEGELLGTPERAISSQAKVGIPLKVQRLEAESRTDSNASTSPLPVREDIV